MQNFKVGTQESLSYHMIDRKCKEVAVVVDK